ncbi:Hypothetical Protein RRSL_00063 [Ralstonia solanacearum UW551]|uniref:Uncharacterized protein n=1 Tax=Ralstonia solanacearum (strain UW551) TaxID=342110 RepID=A0AB33V9B4_RALSU|nr:Hypothetical Protein RRSL_00063 [Ralstonia solanacearum UW551]
MAPTIRAAIRGWPPDTDRVSAHGTKGPLRRALSFAMMLLRYGVARAPPAPGTSPRVHARAQYFAPWYVTHRPIR